MAWWEGAAIVEIVEELMELLRLLKERVDPLIMKWLVLSVRKWLWTDSQGSKLLLSLKHHELMRLQVVLIHVSQSRSGLL